MLHTSNKNTDFKARYCTEANKDMHIPALQHFGFMLALLLTTHQSQTTIHKKNSLSFTEHKHHEQKGVMSHVKVAYVCATSLKCVMCT